MADPASLTSISPIVKAGDRIDAESGHLPRVVVVGAGFGGLTAARALRPARAAVTLFDRNSYHLFRPLLYQVALGMLNASEVAQPVRKLIRPFRNCAFRLAEATAVDLEARQVETDHLSLPGPDERQPEQLLRQPGHRASRAAVRRSHRCVRPSEPGVESLRAGAVGHGRRRPSNPVDVGGGGWRPGRRGTGGRPGRARAPGGAPRLPAARPGAGARAVAGDTDRLLGGFAPSLGQSAFTTLRARGIEVWLNARVAEVGDGESVLADGGRIKTCARLWTAGVRGQELADRVGVLTDRRVEALSLSRLPDHGHDRP